MQNRQLNMVSRREIRTTMQCKDHKGQVVWLAKILKAAHQLALVGAFSMIVKSLRTFVSSSIAQALVPSKV